MAPSTVPSHEPAETVSRPAYVYELDDTTYSYEHPTITGARVMRAAGITATEGLIRLLPDGTRETVDAHDEIHLADGINLKRRPRFKRG
jgi:hypothetical protein